MALNAAFWKKAKGVANLIGSDREGERHAGADHVFEMCEQNDITAQEFFEGAYATAGGNDEELQSRIAELEQDNRNLAEAVNVLNAQQNRNVPDDAGQQLLAKMWSYAQVRLAFSLVFIVFAFWFSDDTFRLFGHKAGLLGYAPPIVKWLMLIQTLGMFWSWAGAEYQRSGVGAVVLKAIPSGMCLYLSVMDFQNERNIAEAEFYVLMTSLVVIPNSLVWVAEQLADSDDEISATLRSWFA